MLQLTGDDPSAYEVGSGGIGDAKAMLNDIRLDARVRSYETDNHLLRIGGGGAFWLPTGNSNSFGGDDQATGYLYGSAEFNFGKFFLAGNLGPQFRPERSIGGAKGALFIASEIRYSGGLYMPLRGGKVRIGGELWGSTGLTESAGHGTFMTLRNTDLEWARTSALRARRTVALVHGGRLRHAPRRRLRRARLPHADRHRSLPHDARLRRQVTAAQGEGDRTDRRRL